MAPFDRAPDYDRNSQPGFGGTAREDMTAVGSASLIRDRIQQQRLARLDHVRRETRRRCDATFCRSPFSIAYG